MTSKRVTGLALILGLAAVVAVTGCSEDNTPTSGDGVGTGGVVVSSLNVSATSADVGATVIVEATVQTTDGVAQSGETVVFSVTPVTAGTVREAPTVIT